MKVTSLQNHPLVQTWLTELRKESTDNANFRKYLKLLTQPLILEATKNIETDQSKIKTPLQETTGYTLKPKIAVAAILRATLGMVDTILEAIPDVTVFHINMHRDEETLEPVWDSDKLPEDCSGYTWIVPDPMLATGGSTIAAVDKLKELGAIDIRYLGAVAAPEGVKALNKAHPDVKVFVAAVDEGLTDGKGEFPAGYIYPGLGDAGDRQFGTF
jgi:uracil phosphoribosyltransferase